MYLVHVHLRQPPGACVPEEIGAWVAHAAESGHVEHVTVHAASPTRPVLGVFLLADCLEEAEQVALTACLRTLAERRELAGWTVIEGYVPLLAPVYDALADGGPRAVD
ncbi:hypothetical protein [Streptomyces sp. NPDC047974]|uniref:hypothetical protein n=1 Tax=Streptomyces sp. NPDC047974 TaxID=3154343 RepID=UPI0033BFCB87